MMNSSRSRPLRAGCGHGRPLAESARTAQSVRISQLCPHKPAELRVEVEALVKRARVGGLREFREGKPIWEWDAKLRKMVDTQLVDSCVVVVDSRERAERLAVALDGVLHLGATPLSAKLLSGRPTPAKQPEPSMEALYQEACEEKARRECDVAAFPALPAAGASLPVDPRVAAGAHLPATTHTPPPPPPPHVCAVCEDASSVTSSAVPTTLAGACRFCKAEGHFARLADGTPSCPALVRKLEREAEAERAARALARKELVLEVQARDLEVAIALKEREHEAELQAVEATAAAAQEPAAASDGATAEPRSRQQKRMEKRKAKSRQKRAEASAAAP